MDEHMDALEILRRKAPLNDNKQGNSPLERGRGVCETRHVDAL